MSDVPHKPLLKLRTFQLDQAHARGETPVPAKPTSVTKEEKPKLSSAPKIVVTTPQKPESLNEEKNSPSTETVLPPTPPAFHELKKSAHKKIEHIVAESAPTQTSSKTVTVRNNQPAPLPRSFSSEATVITSAKKNEFRLFSAITASLKEWFSGFGKKTSSPKYTVNTADRRKGVILKATTNSGAIFTTESDALKQEITKKREIPLAGPAHALHVNWTPKTEAGFPLIEEPHRPALPAKHSVVVEYKKRVLPAPVIVEPQSEILTPVPSPKRVFVPPQEKAASDTARWKSDAMTAPDSPYAATEVLSPRPAPVFVKPQVAPPTPQPVYSAQATAPPLPIPPSALPLDLKITKADTSIPNKPNPKTSYLRNGLRQLFRFDTTAVTVMLVGSLVSFVMVFLIVRTFVGMITPNTPSDTPVVSLAKPLTPSGKVRDVAISSVSYDALVVALAGESRPGSGVTEFRILEATGSVVEGGQLWRLFNFSSDPNLARSITEARLGYANGKPVIFLEVTDALTVFGALLLWEPEMGSELASILEIESSRSTEFTDESIAGNDIRVLQDGTEEILVYGFIKKNTVVITSSKAAYEAALSN